MSSFEQRMTDESWTNIHQDIIVRGMVYTVAPESFYILVQYLVRHVYKNVHGWGGQEIARFNKACMIILP